MKKRKDHYITDRERKSRYTLSEFILILAYTREIKSIYEWCDVTIGCGV